MKRLLPVILFLLAYAGAWAQPSCSQTLRLANSSYEQGRLHELPKLLETCLKTGFTIDEKVQALRLLTLAYIYLEEPEKADATMLLLLQTDSEFQVNDAIDPAEFIALYRTFRTAPVYRIGGKAGTNVAKPNVKSADFANDGTSEYAYRFGFSGGLSAEIPIRILKMKNLTLNPELYFQIFSCKMTNQDTVRNVFGPRSQNWITLPLSIQYSIGTNPKRNFFPYLGVGLETAYLFGATSTEQSIIVDNAGGEEKSFDVAKDMNRMNYFALLSAGAKLKIGKGMAVAELRYHYGLRDVTRVEGTYSNPNLTWDYHSVDAVYKLNYLSLTVGYLVNIYNPKKLKIKK